jgi:hypothetical protein
MHGVCLAGVVSAKAKLLQAERDAGHCLGAKEDVFPRFARLGPVFPADGTRRVPLSAIEDQRELDPAVKQAARPRILQH